MASTDGGSIYTCANCGAIQEEKYMGYSSLFRGWLCSECRPKDDMDVSIRVSQEAHTWLLKNRGPGPVKKLVDKLIEKYNVRFQTGS